MREYKNLKLDKNSVYPTICSFFTPNWEYPQWGKRLAKNCTDLGLNYYISEYPDSKGYLSNCRIKPEHIRRVLQETNTPVLWIDVDGSIYKTPEIFKNCNKDFMAKMMAPERSRYWHVGTLFFNNTPMGTTFLNAWADATNDSSGSDELILDNLWNQSDFKDTMSYSDIPPEYFRMKNKRYRPSNTDVIVHRISTGDAKLKLKKANAYV